MRIASTAVLLLATALPSPAPAGEPAKQAKEARTAKVKKDLAEKEAMADSCRKAIESWAKQGETTQVEKKKKQLAEVLKLIPPLKLELRWLTGELTQAAAVAAVKTAQEAVDKAEKDKAAPEALAPRKAALDQAKGELALIEKWEGDY